MHPIIRRRGWLRLYLAGWLGPALLLVALLAAAGGFGWGEAAALGLPLALAYSQLALSAWYVCRAAPLAPARPARLVRAAVVVTAAAAIASGLWVAMAQLALVGLAMAARSSPGWAPPDLVRLPERLAAVTPLLFGFGVLLYLLAAAGCWLVAAVEASERAERQRLEAEVLARDAELRAVRAQLDPHFLFNSLNTVAALAGSDPAAGRRTAMMVADLLRRGLALAERRMIPLVEELALARAYLDIERVRFGDRLEVEEAVDPAVARVEVPPRILQPLVENAVKHGIAGLLDGGVVRLEAAPRGGVVVVAVDNDRDPDGTAPRPPGERMGLGIVRRRLVAVWGDRARLVVASRPGGFRVELWLPAAAGVGDGGGGGGAPREAG